MLAEELNLADEAVFLCVNQGTADYAHQTINQITFRKAFAGSKVKRGHSGGGGNFKHRITKARAAQNAVDKTRRHKVC